MNAQLVNLLKPLGLLRECLLFSEADAQIDGFSERQQAANGHKRTSVLGNRFVEQA